MQSIYPDYLESSPCKQGTCRRTCCRHDWNVVMSEQEYRANTDASLDPDLLALAHASMKPNPASTGEGDRFYIEMVGDVACPLLNSDGLCSWIQLSGRRPCSTCHSFPCTAMRYREHEYLMPSGACEAVLESFLGREAPVRMVSRDCGEPVERNYYVHITNELVKERPLLGYYPDLVRFGLAVLQDRTRSLDERVSHLLAGLLCVHQLEEQGALELLGSFLERYPLAPSSFQDIPDAPWLAVYACGEMLSHFCCRSAHAPTALRVTEGLGIRMDTRADATGAVRCVPSLESTEVYPAKKAALASFFRRNETFFEHVTVSLYLKMLLPLREPNVWTHALYFAACYATLKSSVVGYFGPLEPTDEQLVDLLVEVIRMETHSELMYPTICKKLAHDRLTSLAFAQALVHA